MLRRLSACFLTSVPLITAAQAPDDRFAALEARLDAAQSVEIEFGITAEGVVAAELDGRLRLEAGRALTLTANGVFAGESIDVAADADSMYLWLDNGGLDTLRTERPDALDEAVLVGLTRMGLLHNLARLTTGRRPDHAEQGGVREWVTVDEFAEAQDGIAFALTVAGQPAGTAVLTLDAAGLPARREQRVAFPEGEMRVIEHYRSVAVEP